MDRRVAMGLLFYPRGGSAQVVLYLARALERDGWGTDLLCGSLGEEGERTNAATFFEGLDVHAASYDDAVDAADRGLDPVAQPFPLHPSFEDRSDAPDRVFAAVSPELGDHLVDAWAQFISRSLDGVRGIEVAHLHHLTTLQEAMARARPGTPTVTHLHGTDLKMIDRIDRLTEIARQLDTDLAGMAARAEAEDLPSFDGLDEGDAELARDTRWSQWAHGAHWAGRLRAAAQRSDRFVVISPHDRDEAQRLLAVEGERVEWIPNGVDTELFDRRELSGDERRERWHEWLVSDPRGWDESGEAGTVSYSDEDLEAFAPDGEPSPVLLFVGRFLDFKRVPLLIRAYARAREEFDRRAPLVVWGGFPGEWEGEHPHTVAKELGVEDVFFSGWRGHDDLARGLAACDLMVAPSVDEPFGQVYLEAMASGLAVIATRSGGPLSFVNTDEDAPNGWLVEPDDEAALADAMVEAVNGDEERRRRADNAYEQVRAEYAWNSLAPRFTELYERAIADRR
jgi:D-inositol-3-phosphate glycosyltransferase